jgi:hypothetical protein
MEGCLAMCENLKIKKKADVIILDQVLMFVRCCMSKEQLEQEKES